MLGKTERSKAQLFYTMLFSSMFALPFALYEWKEIDPAHIKYILAIALCYLVHSVAFFKAFTFSDRSTVMPFDYSRLIFTGILGYYILAEIPDKYSLIGYTLIIVGGICAVIFEAKKIKKMRYTNKAQLEAENSI